MCMVSKMPNTNLRITFVALVICHINVNTDSGDRRTGRPVADNPTVPLHGLAGAGGAQVWRGIHRLYRAGAQDQGAVWPGGAHHSPLQVSEEGI